MFFRNLSGRGWKRYSYRHSYRISLKIQILWIHWHTWQRRKTCRTPITGMLKLVYTTIFSASSFSHYLPIINIYILYSYSYIYMHIYKTLMQTTRFVCLFLSGRFTLDLSELVTFEVEFWRTCFKDAHQAGLMRWEALMSILRFWLCFVDIMLT